MRTTRRIAALAAVAAISVWCSAGVAGAAVTTFAMSPTTGPAGTVVHVSGSGCAPGLLASPSTDFVIVTATALGIALQVPVASSGSWSTSFTVPGGTVPGASLVAVACVSDALASLTTIYTPRTFTVTGAITLPTVLAPTTTPTTPPTTVHHDPGGGGGPTTPATKPRSSAAPGSPSGPDSTPVGTPGDGSRSISTGISARAAASSGASGADGAVLALGAKRAASAGAATLQTADLGARLSASGAGGLGWLGWLLLVVPLLAAAGLSAWLWRSRQQRRAQTLGEPA